MILKRPAVAGTLESSDIMVSVRPNPEKGLSLHLESVVMTTFGEQIRDTVKDVFTSFGVEDAIVDIVDKGAIDCVIRARTQAAICRAAEVSFNWKGEDSIG